MILEPRKPRESLASWNRRLAAYSKQLRRKPGHSFRFTLRDPDYHVIDDGRLEVNALKMSGCRFDELVVDDWLHIEQMDTRAWWMQIGEQHFWITVPRSGPIKLTLGEGPLAPQSKSPPRARMQRIRRHDSNSDNTCCASQVPAAGGARPGGERWRCPICCRWWVHIVDEAEGAAWEIAQRQRR